MTYSLSALWKHCVAVGINTVWTLRNNSPSVFRKLITDQVDANIRANTARKEYQMISNSELLAHRNSERIFLFGSGYSLNEIPDETWKQIGKDDSLGFSGSIYMQKIPLTYLLLRAWTETPAGSLAWQSDAREVLDVIENNSYLDQTVFCFPVGITSIFTNRLIGHRLWDARHPVFYYLPDKRSKYPHQNFKDGLVHGVGTLCSAISLAVALGYREIVLAGVDLYDNRYFWLPPDKTLGWSESEKKAVASDTTFRGVGVNSQHNTTNNGVIELIGGWARYLEETSGQRISVFNPRSLLAGNVPVFSWPDGEVDK